MKVLTIHARVEDYEKAASFIEDWLQHMRLSKQIILENGIVFETLFNDILLKGFHEDTEIKIETGYSVGNPMIKIGFSGPRYVPISADDMEKNIEYKIIKAYEDKLSYDYRLSYNIIWISMKRNYAPLLILCAAGFLTAILAYTLLSHTIDSAAKSALVNNWVVPIETLFTNAMLMIGTPMTFFSILKNLLETHVVAERSSIARKLQRKTVATSIAAVLLAVVLGFFIARLSTYINGMFGDFVISGYTRRDLPQLISSLMPSDIFEPFKLFSPYPLILLSFLIIIALRSVDNQFDRLKDAVDACYVLFSKMLNLVILILPVFCFLAFLHLLLEKGFAALYGVLICWGLVLLGIGLLLLLYALRLKLAGIKVIRFTKKILPVLKENIMINSAIDAVPFNIRQCSKILGISRNYLEDTMPVLAQINLDGNCFILMEITMLLIVSGGTSILWWNYLLLAVLVIFLSIGAPNQPGSILIGMLIIINYLKIPNMLPVAIYCEVLLGTLQNLVNVIGDIVMSAVDNRKSISDSCAGTAVS